MRTFFQNAIKFWEIIFNFNIVIFEYFTTITFF